jgi:CDP-6-deoxy-D-xylo-4-hexulose-3-dehydrase
MPEATAHADPSWFGFPITIDPSSGIDREALLRHLESLNIGTRLMFAGNITRQPAYADVDFRVLGTLQNSDIVMRQSFWVGVYPGLATEQLDFVAHSISEWIQAHE